MNGCILIPAYNEEAHVAAVIEKARQHLPVIVVDDGSVDRTADVAGNSGAIVIRQIPNQGKGAALQRGFREALSLKFDYILTLDADGQHDPDEIPLFLNAFRQNHSDLIIGYRDFLKMPLIRKLSNTIGGRAFSWAMRQPIRDNQSGYRLLSGDLAQILINSEETGFEYEVEMIVLCLQHLKRLDWVPISTIYAGESSHIRPLHHLINFIRIVLQTRKRTRYFGKMNHQEVER